LPRIFSKLFNNIVFFFKTNKIDVRTRKKNIEGGQKNRER